MANWDVLKSAIAGIIKTNGNQEITGQLLQNVLNNIVSSVGKNATFAGIAYPTSNPGTPDGPVFYLATTEGVYANFGGINVSLGEAVVLLWDNGSWVKRASGFATQNSVSAVKNFDAAFPRSILLPELLKIYPLDMASICLKEGYYISTSGNYSADANYMCSERIFVKKGTTLYFKDTAGREKTILRISEWNLDGTYAQNIDGASQYIASNDVFIAFSLVSSTVASTVLHGSASTLEDKIEATNTLAEKRKSIIFLDYYSHISGIEADNLEEALAMVPEEDRVGLGILVFKAKSSQRYQLYYLISGNKANWLNSSLWYKIYTGSEVDALLSPLQRTVNKAFAYLTSLVKTFYDEKNEKYGRIDLPNSVDLTTEGDYIEWECANPMDTPDSIGLSMIKGNKTNAGIYLNKQFWFRSNSASGADYRQWQLDLTFDPSAMHKYKIINTAEGWELIIDGRSYGKVALSQNANISMLGVAYSGSQSFGISFVFKSFTAHSAISGDVVYNQSDLFNFASGGVSLVSDTIDLQSQINAAEYLAESNERVLGEITKQYRDKTYSSYNEDPEKYSFTKITSPLVLRAPGDYVEIVCQVRDQNKAGAYLYMLNLLSNADSPVTNSRFGWYDSNSIWLRPTGDSSYKQWSGLPKNQGWKKIKLAVVDAGWELFIDDISYGVREKGADFPIRMVGAMSSTKPAPNIMGPQNYDIRTCYVHTSEGDAEYSPLGLYSGSQNVVLHDYVEVEEEDTEASHNPLCFVSYSASQKRFKVYMRDKQNQSIYYMISVFLNSTVGTKNEPIAYSHFWEIDGRSKRCIYSASANAMAEYENIIAGGESECVFMYTDPAGTKVDFTGGVHGDERIDIDPSSFVKFYIDGVKLTDDELSQDIFLKACNSFQYIQKSSMHDTAITVYDKETNVEASGEGILSLDSITNHFLIDGVDTGIVAYAQNTLMSTSGLAALTLSKSETNKWKISEVVQLIEGHPIVATHIKKTTFANQSYRTENTLMFNSSRLVSLWYHGICSLSKNCATIGHNEDYEDSAFAGTNESGMLSKREYRMFEAYNPNTKISARISSELINGGDVITDKECSMFIWDRVADSKYYRKTPSFNPQIGKRLVSVITVQFGTTEY